MALICLRGRDTPASNYFYNYLLLRPNSWTKSRQKSEEFSSLLFSHLSSFWDCCSFKLAQPLRVSTVQLLYTVKEKWGKPNRKPYHLPYDLRNPYRNLKSENSQDYAQKPQWNCTFMNLASEKIWAPSALSKKHADCWTISMWFSLFYFYQKILLVKLYVSRQLCYIPVLVQIF